MKLPLARIEEFLNATGECELKEVATGYSIDSRTIQPGDLFFAVKGERLDGHDFVQQALERGAVSAVVRKDQLARYSVKTCLLAVDDTLVALQTLATAVRRLWGKPVVGVTGSAGKTTTKEAIAHVLGSRFRVLKWLPAYLKWFRYAFATTYLRRSPDTVVMRSQPLRTA